MLGQEAPAQGGQNWVKDTTTANFRQDVISESARQPVLVDFWAPWCGHRGALVACGSVVGFLGWVMVGLFG